MVGMAFIHPVLQIVHAQIILYCYMNNLPYDITRTIGKGIPGISTSTTHEEARAIDFSVRGWTDKQRDNFVKEFNDRFKSIAAISAKSKVPVLAVDHKGTGWHIHIQIRRDIPTMSNEELNKLLRRVKWLN